MTTLIECPWGHEDEAWVELEQDEGRWAGWVECGVCGCRGVWAGWYKDEERARGMAAEYWNSRKGRVVETKSLSEDRKELIWESKQEMNIVKREHHGMVIEHTGESSCLFAYLPVKPLDIPDVYIRYSRYQVTRHALSRDGVFRTTWNYTYAMPEEDAIGIFTDATKLKTDGNTSQTWKLVWIVGSQWFGFSKIRMKFRWGISHDLYALLLFGVAFLVCLPSNRKRAQ